MKKIFIGLGIAVAGIAVLLIATGSFKFNASFGPKESPVPTGWVKYTSGEFGYSLIHPDGWNLQENSGPTSRDLLILAPGGKAFVRIAAFKDESLTTPAALEASIAEYKASFANKPQELLKEFQGKVEGNLGGFGATGAMEIAGVAYQFLERGLLSTNGRVLIMRGAVDAKSVDVETLSQDVRKIMDSFEVQ